MNYFKDLLNVTKEELLENAEEYKWDSQIEFNDIIIIPNNELHDSGWDTMTFIMIDYKNEKMYKSFGGSDVLHINGIGGYGEDYKKTILTNMVPRTAWHIDCLPCGLLRLFCGKRLKTGYGLSDFEIYTIEE